MRQNDRECHIFSHPHSDKFSSATSRLPKGKESSGFPFMSCTQHPFPLCKTCTKVRVYKSCVKRRRVIGFVRGCFPLSSHSCWIILVPSSLRKIYRTWGSRYILHFVHRMDDVIDDTTIARMILIAGMKLICQMTRHCARTRTPFPKDAWTQG